LRRWTPVNRTRACDDTNPEPRFACRVPHHHGTDIKPLSAQAKIAIGGDEIHDRVHLRPPGEGHAADAQDRQYDQSNSERTHLEKIQQRGLVWTATARLTRDRARRARDAASGTYVTFAPAGGKLRRDSPFGYGST
jgi:hypothetical protein